MTPDREVLAISLLGGFRARVGASTVQLPTRKTQALLAYLSLEPGASHDREKIQGLLWPDAPPRQAQASLRQTLFTLRKSLPGASAKAVVTTATTVALDASHLSVDVALLERHLGGATRDEMEVVASLYTGHLLEAFVVDEAPFDQWIDNERSRLREVALGMLEQLVDVQASAGEGDKAIQTALHSLRLDPLRESTHRALMQLYAASGRRGAAVQQYRSLVHALARELGVEPDGQTKGLHDEILRMNSAVAGPAPPAASSTLRALARPARGPTPAPLLGRDGEVARLCRALDAGWGGGGKLTLVSGDAGVGKTRILEDVALDARRRGARILWGRCFESEEVLPFAVWADLLREDESPPAPPVMRDTRALFDAVTGSLAALARQAPLLVVVDDLQWSDAMSLRLLSFLVRRLAPSAPVCFMAAVRAEEVAVAPFLRTVLQELEREQCLVPVEIAPLSRSDSKALIHALARGVRALDPGCLVEPVWAMSEGNPLTIVETMRGLAGAPPTVGSPLPVPSRIRELVLRRLASLDALAQEVLATAAVIGREFDFALLRAACPRPPRELAATLEELVRRRILTGTHDAFYFTHARVRDVVHASLSPLRRKVLHDAVAHGRAYFVEERRSR